MWFSLVPYKIGDDLSTSLWLDDWKLWHPLGSLYNKLGNRVVSDLGRPSKFLSAKAASV